MVSMIRHLAKREDAYLAGNYLLLSYGKGTHIARIELESGKRYRIRRLAGRGTDNAAWQDVTTWISKTDERIIGRLGFCDVVRHAPVCEAVPVWVQVAAGIAREARELADAAAREALNRKASGLTGLRDLPADVEEFSPEWHAARDIDDLERRAVRYMEQAERYEEEVSVLGRIAAIRNAAAAVEGVELKAEPVVQEEPVVVEDAAIVTVAEPVEAGRTPTRAQYLELDLAYDHFNRELFDAELPPCLLTMNRKAKAHGYFCGDRFQTRDGAIVTDEIALNPDSMRDRDDRESLATLVHEMAHLWQHRFGEPPRKSYHDRQWALKMREVGLIPSSTGEPGGKETGSRVTHYIEEGGRFALSYEALVATGWTMPFIQTPGDIARAKKQKASKTKFQCPCCEQAAWGKPTLKIICSECDELMVAEVQDPDQEAGEEA